MAAISIDPTLVRRSAGGTTTPGVAGAVITAGQALYIDVDNNNVLKLADANGTTPANTFAGIALNNAPAAGMPVDYCPLDTALVLGATLLAGDTIWLSTTAGGLTRTIADLTSGTTVIVVGVMATTTTLVVKPIVGGAVA